MPTYIYPTAKGNFLKVCEEPNKARCKNKGCLQHKIHPGTLNFTQALIDQLPASILRKSAGKLISIERKRFNTSKMKSTRSHGGTVYLGWIDFGSVEEAVIFLMCYFKI